MPVGIRKQPQKQAPFCSGGVGGVTFGTLTAEVGNARTQSVTLTDENGKALNTINHVTVYLSTDSAGAGVAGVAATSILQGTNGYLLNADVTGKVSRFLCKNDGTLDIVVTDAAVRTVYLCFVLENGKVVVSPAIAFA